MKQRFTVPAFTLIEMIIAITVFSIFIGFAVSSYLAFHRADQEALVDRSLMMEAGQVMDLLTADIQANKIDYEYYEDLSSGGVHIMHGFGSGGLSLSPPFSFGFGSDHELNKSILVLRSVDGLTRTVYEWDEEDLTLSVDKFDMTSGTAVELPDYPQLLTSGQVYLNDVNFRIFPDVDPYDSATDPSDDEVQFQPVVTLNLTFAAVGRVRAEVTLPLQTTVTSRFYQ